MKYLKNYKIKILFTSIIIILTLVCVTGCKKIEQPKPETEINNILQNKETINALTVNNEKISSLSGGEISNIIMNNITYEIKKIDVKKTTAICDIVFTYPDILTIIDEYEKTEQKDFTQFLTEQMNGTFSTKQTDLAVEMSYLNNKWYIIVTDELYNILMGGAYNYYIEYEKELYETIKSNI